MKYRLFRFPIAIITAGLVLLIAVLAGGSLWLLRRSHRQVAHSTAAMFVIERGRLISSHLAGQSPEDGDWASFARQVSSLYTVEEGLQYVAVAEDGVVVFQRQRNALDGSEPAEGTGSSVVPPERVGVSRERLGFGDDAIPVVVFSSRYAGSDGALRVVEIALRKETVEREERSANHAIASMFQLSLLTILVSFGTCVVVVVWMMHRESLRELRRRKEEHLAFAGVLANGIVHDFRNPMSSMRLDVQMLARETTGDGELRTGRIRELAERLRGTIDRMDKVFREFLYMSKPGSADMELLDLRDCLSECVSLLKPRLEQADLEVDLQLPDEPVPVCASSSALSRAMMNVITNAEQFSPQGGALRIVLATENRTASIDVIDEGPGVAPRDRERIFEMFESQRPEGTGLGLFLARAAIERCGGRIDVVDSTGPGACFRIRISIEDGGGENG